MKIKLVGFDWDGTLTKTALKNSWNAINDLLGCTEQMDALEDRYYRKEFDYLEWCRLCIDMYKRFGLTEKMLRESVDRDTTLHKGALETINELRSRGIKVGIISGGIHNMYEYASCKFGLSVDYVTFAARLNFDKESGALVGGDYDAHDFEGKIRVLNAYLKKANATLEETLYVGDSHNDIPIFKAATGLAFSSDSEELRKNAKYVIEGDDLREILKYVT
ncbi:Phosphoserine phosphatase [uncultured archaeon]|nr:Phosphoserine phosphatase [uncultured archaeon]